MAAGKTADTDVIVIGGGLAGATLTALLATHGVRAVCIDRDDPAAALGQQYDTRTTAISFGSQRVIAAAGGWDAALLQPCPIRDIYILADGSPVLLEFLVDEVGEDALGWIVDNRALRQSLFERLRALPDAGHIAPARVTGFSVEPDMAAVHLDDGRTLRAPLIVGADGRHSFTRRWMDIPVREWSYNQQAVICPVTHAKPHNHIAVEHFLSEGPFAVLPMSDDAQGRHRSALVWSEHKKRGGMLEWSDEIFLAALNALLPDFYGGATSVGKRVAYPLSLTHAYRYVGPRMALVADAAHAIHPIAGQGLNLGLRDIAVLAELVVEAKDNGQDIVSDDLLARYQRLRRPDNTLMAAATDGLNRLFSNKSRLIGLARKAGLGLVQKTPAARRFFMRQAMGAPNAHLPRLIREGTLR